MPFKNCDDLESMSGSMKALQIIQTIMLIVVVGIGGWIGNTTVESKSAIIRMEEQVKSMANEQSRIDAEMTRLWDAQTQIDHRVTIIESKIK